VGPPPASQPRGTASSSSPELTAERCRPPTPAAAAACSVPLPSTRHSELGTGPQLPAQGTRDGDDPRLVPANPSRPRGRLPPRLPARTLVQDGIRRLVPRQGLFREMLVALGKALHFSQTGVQGHGRVTGVLGHVEVRSPPQLLLDHQGLLQQLGGTGGEGFSTRAHTSINQYHCTGSSCPRGLCQQSPCPAGLPTGLAPKNPWGNRLSPSLFLTRSDTERPRKGSGQHFHSLARVGSRQSTRRAHSERSPGQAAPSHAPRRRACQLPRITPWLLGARSPPATTSPSQSPRPLPALLPAGTGGLPSALGCCSGPPRR